MYYLVIRHDDEIMQALKLPQFPKEALPELQETIQAYSPVMSEIQYEIVSISKLPSREIRELKEFDKLYNARIEQLKESGRFEAYQIIDLGLILLNQIEDINDRRDAILEESKTDSTKQPEQVEERKKEANAKIGDSVHIVKDRPKGGRPTNIELDTVCIHIVIAFAYNSKFANSNWEEYENMTNFSKLLKFRIQNAGSNINISRRRFDIDTIPGKLYRYCLHKYRGIFKFGYNEEMEKRDETLFNDVQRKATEHLENIGAKKRQSYFK